MNLQAIHGILFLDEAWARSQAGSAVVLAGAFLSGRRASPITRLDLPRPGDRVYRGLPLARILSGKTDERLIPAPVSGEVTEVNRHLKSSTDMLWRDPCGGGWMARIAAFDLAGSLEQNQRRSVLLVPLGRRPVRQLVTGLSRLGCQVLETSLQQVLWAINNQHNRVVVLDGVGRPDRLGQAVRWLARLAPDVSLVAVADRGELGDWAPVATRVVEYPFRLSYYPELNEAVYACFRPRSRHTQAVRNRAALSDHIQRFQVSNGRGQRATVILTSQVLNQFVGLERELITAAIEGSVYVRVPTEPIGRLSSEVKRARLRGDHLVVLQANDTGRIPGSLVVEPLRVANPFRGGWDRTLTRIGVQPARNGSRPRAFDALTTRALARGVFREIAAQLGLSRPGRPAAVAPQGDSWVS